MARKKILIVDGDMALGEKMAHRFKEEKFQAKAVSSGEDAMEILKEEWVDLVILSVKLQGEMDGFQLIKSIKDEKELSEIPVIMESDKPGMRSVFEKIGAAEYFIKPCSTSFIIEKTRKLLDQ